MLALCSLGIALSRSSEMGTFESDSWCPTFGGAQASSRDRSVSPCGGTPLKYSLSNSDLEDLHENPALNTAGIRPSLHRLNSPLS